MSTPPVIRSTHSPVIPEEGGARNRLAIVGGIVAAIVVIGAAIAFLRPGAAEPRLNDSTPVLAKFAASKSFDALPFEKQRLFYKVLDDRGGEIEDALKGGKLTDPEYRAAIEAAWLGKHINRTEKYMAMPSSGRAAYINDLLVKKAKKDAKQAASGKSGKDDDDDDIKTDETAAELRVESWPANVREQWKTFHAAYREEKKRREDATTRPANG